MTQGTEDPRKKLTLYIEKVIESIGYPAAAARIYAHLLLSGQPLTINEIARETGLGRSTVAMNLKLLEHNGLVYSVKQGKQKLFYARNAFPHLVRYPLRIMREYCEPILRILEELRDQGEPYRSLHSELQAYLEAARKALRVFEEELKKRGITLQLYTSEA